MKLKKIACALALGGIVWTGAAMADELINEVINSDGTITQYWVSSDGSFYTRHCDVAGNCWGGDTRSEK